MVSTYVNLRNFFPAENLYFFLCFKSNIIQVAKILFCNETFQSIGYKTFGGKFEIGEQ